MATSWSPPATSPSRRTTRFRKSVRFGCEVSLRPEAERQHLPARLSRRALRHPAHPNAWSSSSNTRRRPQRKPPPDPQSPPKTLSARTHEASPSARHTTQRGRGNTGRHEASTSFVAAHSFSAPPGFRGRFRIFHRTGKCLPHHRKGAFTTHPSTATHQTSCKPTTHKDDERLKIHEALGVTALVRLWLPV